MADTVKARLQQSDGTYLRASKLAKDAPAFSAQEFLMQLAEGKTDLDAIPTPGTKRDTKAAEKTATAAD
jgi:polyphosphate kinase